MNKRTEDKRKQRDKLRGVIEGRRISRLSEKALGSKLEELKKFKNENGGTKGINMSTVLNVIAEKREEAWEAESKRTYAQYNYF